MPRVDENKNPNDKLKQIRTHRVTRSTSLNLDLDSDYSLFDQVKKQKSKKTINQPVKTPLQHSTRSQTLTAIVEEDSNEAVPSLKQPNNNNILPYSNPSQQNAIIPTTTKQNTTRSRQRRNQLKVSTPDKVLENLDSMSSQIDKAISTSISERNLIPQLKVSSAVSFLNGKQNTPLRLNNPSRLRDTDNFPSNGSNITPVSSIDEKMPGVDTCLVNDEITTDIDSFDIDSTSSIISTKEMGDNIHQLLLISPSKERVKNNINKKHAINPSQANSDVNKILLNEDIDQKRGDKHDENQSEYNVKELKMNNDYSYSSFTPFNDGSEVKAPYISQTFTQSLHPLLIQYRTVNRQLVLEVSNIIKQLKASRHQAEVYKMQSDAQTVLVQQLQLEIDTLISNKSTASRKSSIGQHKPIESSVEYIKLKNQNTDLQYLADSLTQERDNAINETLELKNSIKNLELEIEKLKMNAEMVAAQDSSIEILIKNHTNEIKDLKDNHNQTINDLNIHIKQLQEDILQLNKNETLLISDISSYKTNISSLTCRLEASDERFKSTELCLSQTQTLLDNCRLSLTQNQTQLSLKTSELINTQSDIVSLQEKLLLARQEIHSLQNDNEILKTKQNESDVNNNIDQDENVAVDISTHPQFISIENQLGEKMRQISEYDDNILKLKQTHINDIEQSKLEYNNALAIYLQQIDNLRKDNHELSSAYRDLELKYTHCNNKSLQLQNENNIYQSQYNNIVAQFETCHNTLSLITSEFKTQQNSYILLENRYNEQNNIINKLILDKKKLQRVINIIKNDAENAIKQWKLHSYQLDDELNNLNNILLYESQIHTTIENDLRCVLEQCRDIIQQYKYNIINNNNNNNNNDNCINNNDNNIYIDDKSDDILVSHPISSRPHHHHYQPKERMKDKVAYPNKFDHINTSNDDYDDDIYKNHGDYSSSNSDTSCNDHDNYDNYTNTNDSNSNQLTNNVLFENGIDKKYTRYYRTTPYPRSKEVIHQGSSGNDKESPNNDHHTEISPILPCRRVYTNNSKNGNNTNNNNNNNNNINPQVTLCNPSIQSIINNNTINTRSSLGVFSSHDSPQPSCMYDKSYNQFDTTENSLSEDDRLPIDSLFSSRYGQATPLMTSSKTLQSLPSSPSSSSSSSSSSTSSSSSSSSSLSPIASSSKLAINRPRIETALQVSSSLSLSSLVPSVLTSVKESHDEYDENREYDDEYTNCYQNNSHKVDSRNYNKNNEIVNTSNPNQAKQIGQSTMLAQRTRRKTAFTKQRQVLE